VWKDLFKITDTQLIMSSSYHPQTDGQTERLNQCLEVFIPVPSSGLSGHPFLNSGIILLIIQLYADPLLRYFMDIHQDILVLPMIFSLMHQSWSNGFWKEIFCRMLFSINCKEPNIEWNTMLTRTENDSIVDDLVYHKLQPYIQSSVAPRSNQKLSFPYYGPFKVQSGCNSLSFALAW
jgi:hypothetical protein